MLKSSKFTGRQDLASFSVSHTVQQADTTQHGAQGLQTVSLQLGHDVPAAIGRVQAADCRVAAPGNLEGP